MSATPNFSEISPNPQTQYQAFLRKFNHGTLIAHFNPEQLPRVGTNKITFYLKGGTPPAVIGHLRGPKLAAKVVQAARDIWSDTTAADVRYKVGEEQPANNEPPSSPQTSTIVKGFTPVIDSLTQEVGLIPGAIYGVIWRYCQMNSRTCYAEQKTIARKLKLSRKCVNQNIKVLLNLAYIRCLNENEKGKSRVYIVTNKVNITMGIIVKANTDGQA